METYCCPWEQIAICGIWLKHMGTEYNLWKYVLIGRNKLRNIWEQIRIFSSDYNRKIIWKYICFYYVPSLNLYNTGIYWIAELLTSHMWHYCLNMSSESCRVQTVYFAYNNRKNIYLSMSSNYVDNQCLIQLTYATLATRVSWLT